MSLLKTLSFVLLLGAFSVTCFGQQRDEMIGVEDVRCPIDDTVVRLVGKLRGHVWFVLPRAVGPLGTSFEASVQFCSDHEKCQEAETVIYVEKDGKLLAGHFDTKLPDGTPLNVHFRTEPLFKHKMKLHCE